MSESMEDRLRKVFVEEPPRLDSTVGLVEYDPAWPGLFGREAERIRAALGPVAVVVEHIGSTSVPGLAAKPVVDVVLGVPDSEDEAAYVPALEAAGYVVRVREPEAGGHRLFKGPDTDVNVHVYSAGHVEIDRYLRFRDRLRAVDAERELYEATKRELAARRWSYLQEYADA
ncbi:MAG: GrpB family protein, partial [Umezawaea sp.]